MPAVIQRKSKTVLNHRFRQLQSSGLTIEQLAKKLDYSPKYLRTIFCHGHATFCLAEDLSRELGCKMEFFL